VEVPLIAAGCEGAVVFTVTLTTLDNKEQAVLLTTT
jgi:hypothetical protein